MNQRDMNFLNAVDAERWDDETVVRQVRKAAAVLTRKSDGHEASLPRNFQPIDQVWRLPARADGQSHIFRPREQSQLVREYSGEILIVADRGNRRHIGHQSFGRQGPPLFDNRVFKLDGGVECVAGATAVTHDVESLPLAKPSRHLPAKRIDLIRVHLEKALLHVDAFTHLPEDGFTGTHRDTASN